MESKGKKPIRVEKKGKFVEFREKFVCREKLFTKLKKINIKKMVMVICIIVIMIILGVVIVSFLLSPNIEDVKNSVVMIEIYEDGELTGSGSGFCAFENNMIVTNFHVIEGAKKFKVITDSKKSYNVEDIVVFSKKHDLAIIKINGELGKLQLGNSDRLKIKDSVTAIGSPKRELNTVSTGIVSNTDEKGIIRTSVPISHGSSGGVLLNNRNKVIGITSAGYDDAQNLNFAIDVNVLKKLYSSYKNDEYNLITESNSSNCLPAIEDYYGGEELSIREKCNSTGYYVMVPKDMNVFYNSTNQYEIFDTAIKELDSQGFYKKYKKFNDKSKKQVVENYNYLEEHDIQSCYETGDGEYFCNYKDDISSWSIERFILELDLLEKYQLAIFMVDSDNHFSSLDNLVNYLNDTDLSYESKIILNKLFYEDDDRYNYDIIEFFNNDERFDYDQTIDVFEYLGFTIKGDKIYW